MMASHAEFFAAVKQGDVAAVEEYFEHPLVIAMVHDVNARTMDPSPWRHMFLDSWCYSAPSAPQEANGDHTSANVNTKRVHAFQVAIDNDQMHVLAWFLGEQRVSLLGATLTRMMPRIARSAVNAQHAEAMELLLCSHMYRSLLSRSEKQVLLQEALVEAMKTSSIDMIELLISHGACVDDIDSREDPQRSCAAHGDRQRLDVLVKNGTMVVGSPTLLQHAVSHNNMAIAGRLLELGVDHKYGIDRAAAEREPELMEILLEKSFADVEASELENWTPLLWLMHMRNNWMSLRGVVRTTSCERRAERTARLLIEFGADVHATTEIGQTALHLAVSALWDIETVELLLQYGADPNATTREGKSVLDCVILAHAMADDDPQTAALAHLEILLTYGADPFAIGDGGRSTRDRLMDTVAGQAFVAAHPSYFLGTERIRSRMEAVVDRQSIVCST